LHLSTMSFRPALFSSCKLTLWRSCPTASMPIYMQQTKKESMLTQTRLSTPTQHNPEFFFFKCKSVAAVGLV
jgi:hypothetical protein